MIHLTRIQYQLHIASPPTSRLDCAHSAVHGKNLARRYGLSNGTGPDGADPWAHLFAQAAAERGDASDVTPYWVFAVPDGAVIERHVPALPLSRDTDRLERLRRSLAAYRMVFGQARQEELLAYLLSHFRTGETAPLVDGLRIDLAP